MRFVALTNKRMIIVVIERCGAHGPTDVGSVRIPMNSAGDSGAMTATHSIEVGPAIPIDVCRRLPVGA